MKKEGETMFNVYYGLTFNPFSKDCDVKYHYKSQDYIQAMSRLEFLKDKKGFGLITGDPGSGKSYTLKCFVTSLNPNMYKVVYIPISTLTVMDFYRYLSDGLGLIPKHRKCDMFRQIQDVILSYHSKNITPVIIIDEAQFISNSILDDLRIIFNFDMDTKNYALLILSGQTQLIIQLNRQAHEALRQRIVLNYSFKGLNKDETKEYITSRLKCAGCNETIFTDDAIELIYSSTNGYLRKINLLAEMSMILGAKESQKTINGELVFRAQSDINITE
ncbi:AAA family ATPase [Thermoanaerobacterium thermosaccharolyticum]|uniref:ExeA family protein n=2 Tax=Thermoanaerobacterium TaxID=28895 RepID=UPI003DA9D1A7